MRINHILVDDEKVYTYTDLPTLILYEKFKEKILNLDNMTDNIQTFIYNDYIWEFYSHLSLLLIRDKKTLIGIKNMIFDDKIEKIILSEKEGLFYFLSSTLLYVVETYTYKIIYIVDIDQEDVKDTYFNVDCSKLYLHEKVIDSASKIILDRRRSVSNFIPYYKDIKKIILPYLAID